jgi:hypothetical protein
VFSPKHKPYIEFSSGEEINNWLLVNPEVRAHMSRPAPPGSAQGRDGVLRRRNRADLRGARLRPDPAGGELREHLDSKLVTTRLGNEVGAPACQTC